MRRVKWLVGGIAIAGIVLSLTGTANASRAATSPSTVAAPADTWNPTIGGQGVPVPPYTEVSGASGVYAPSYLPNCPLGYVCVAVPRSQDGRTNVWRIWNLYRCGDYALYNWYGRGWIRNNQTGGATVYRMNSVYTRILPGNPPDNRWLDINWQPAWYLQTCG
jgi:hypothetical protein